MLEKNIVLLHGWGASIEKLKPLAKNLRKLGWCVFFPKLPGFEAKAPPKAWDLKEYSKYVLVKAKKKFGKKKFFIFGHSFGGRIAIKTSLLEKKSVAGVVLCAAGGLSRASSAKRAMFFVLAKSGKALLIYPSLAKKFKKLIYKIAREHDYEKIEGVMKETFKKVVAEDLKHKIKNVTIPTLILWGKNDKMTPHQDALFVQKNLVNSKLVTFPDQGHRLPYQKPVKIAKEVNKWYQSLS